MVVGSSDTPNWAKANAGQVANAFLVYENVNVNIKLQSQSCVEIRNTLEGAPVIRALGLLAHPVPAYGRHTR